MDQNMDSSNPTPENQPPQTPEQPPQPAAPPEYNASAPPIPEQPAAQTETSATNEASKDAKMWGMFCHLAALAGYLGIPFGNVLGPLIIWLIKKDDFEFVNDQGKESLNFQISISIYSLAAGLLMCLGGIGILLLIPLGIFGLVMVIIASIAANKGETYRYPLCIRLVK